MMGGRRRNKGWREGGREREEAESEHFYTEDAVVMGEEGRKEEKERMEGGREGGREKRRNLSISTHPYIHVPNMHITYILCGL
jgi:hypothetical protein